MAKFKMTFKIQGFELEIEGERNVVPQLTQAVHKQLSGMLLAPAGLANGAPLEAAPESPAPPAKVKRKSPRTVTRSSGETSAVAVDFSHDPNQWGNPLQTWSTPKKAIWLLFVAEAEANITEMDTATLVITFNKHFRQARQVSISQVNRDLGAAKTRTPSLVGEDTSKTPPKWFLTDEGKKQGRKLVDEAKGSAVSSEP